MDLAAKVESPLAGHFITTLSMDPASIPTAVCSYGCTKQNFTDRTDGTAVPTYASSHHPISANSSDLVTTSPSSSSTVLAAPSQPPYWYETIDHNGQASFMDNSDKANYRVFRNVVNDFQADNTGQTDASGAIQNAINGIARF